jgi:hypothetical protein
MPEEGNLCGAIGRLAAPKRPSPRAKGPGHRYFTMIPQENTVLSPDLTPQSTTVISLPAPAG